VSWKCWYLMDYFKYFARHKEYTIFAKRWFDVKQQHAYLSKPIVEHMCEYICLSMPWGEWH
jgi:hypothetical protein